MEKTSSPSSSNQERVRNANTSGEGKESSSPSSPPSSSAIPKCGPEIEELKVAFSHCKSLRRICEDLQRLGYRSPIKRPAAETICNLTSQLSQPMDHFGFTGEHAAAQARVELQACYEWARRHVEEADRYAAKSSMSKLLAKLTSKSPVPADDTRVHVLQLYYAVRFIEFEITALMPLRVRHIMNDVVDGVALLRDDCGHKFSTMCSLPMSSCCACAGRRPYRGYTQHVDGITVSANAAARWQYYCQPCKKDWMAQSPQAPPQAQKRRRNWIPWILQNDRKGKKAIIYEQCEICSETKPTTAFPSQITSNCGHGVDTCSSCIQKWIHSVIASKDLDNLRCFDCSGSFEYEDVRRHASAGDFTLFDNVMLQNRLSMLPNFHWCLNPSCPSGQLHDTTDSPIFTCVACNSKSCITHNIPWHEGLTCDEFDQEESGKAIRRLKEKSQEIIAKTTKICPGEGCGARIEKNKGCDHVKCKKCKHEFCWLCFTDFQTIQEIGKSAHEKTCKYYRLGP